jgi:hypothetical protein
MKLIRTATLSVAITLALAGAAMAQAAGRPAPPRTPHPTAGKTDCLSCHGPTATAQVQKTPPEHKYASPACLACHRLAAVMPPPSTHAMDAAHARCGVCHVVGSPTHAKPVPASHTRRNGTTCQMCHQQAAAG